MSNAKQTEILFVDKGNAILSRLPGFVRDYIRSIHNRTSPRTRYEYLKDIENFLIYVFAHYTPGAQDLKGITTGDLAKLTKSDFEGYFEHLEHYTKDGREITNSRVSIKRKMSSLRRFFAYLFENELIPSDNIRKVEQPKISKKEIIRLEPDEMLDMVNAAGSLSPTPMTSKQRQYHQLQYVRDSAIICLFLSSGLRVSELVSLDLDDIDMTRHLVHVVRKGGDEASVYFSDEASAVIGEYLNWRKENKDIPDDEKALFVSSRGSRFSVRAVEKLIAKYAARVVPGKHITPHKLRATYATNLYNATGDIYLVAECLGHKDVTTTKNHYADMSSKHKEAARNLISLS